MLEISGNNITNNGTTTGAGLIKISSNDFTNNKELASNAVIIDGRGNVVNNNMITGNDGKINGNSITNNDLIAFDNYLEMNAKSKVLNNKDKSIYGGNALIIKGSEILNDEGEILGGNMDLNASKITNNVGTVQSTGDIFVTSNDFQNIGRVTGLGNYEKYYETWDRQRLSESEIASKWLLNDNGGWKKKTSGHTRKKARKEQKEWFEKQIQNSNRSESKSYLLTKYEQFFRSILGHTNVDDSKKVAGSAKDPTIPLVGKLKSKATTEYGKVLANGNITINSGNFKNKDSLISGGGLVNITATNFENSVSIDDKNPIKLKNGREVLDLNIKEGTHHHIPRTTLVAVHTRDMVDGDIGYATGQPSIIEGSLVNVNAPNIIKNSIEAGNGKVLNNGGATGRALISSNSIGINKGTGSANGAVQVAGNTLLSKVNSGFNGNLQVNGSGNNSFDRAIQISGNNSVIQNIKKTGTIDVNPLLSSAMFTMNMGPSSKYLLETRSKYISLGQYYGSDYFTSRVGYSEIWDRSKRLGDAFYENQLLTRALNEKLGTSFLNGKSNQELIQSMMDNAADEKARLGLVVGQALTQDQINALNEDIIWYVSKEVNGVSVLTPQIYLSSRTRESISDDTRNRIGGINGTYVKTKDFVNDGTKWGNGGVTYVEANTVRNETTTNLLSEISGDRTFISSVGNIENIGGKIKGNEVVALISENGNVINNTTKRKVGFNNGEFDRSWHEEIGSIGQISSNGLTFIKGNSYESTGGILNTNHLELDVNKFNVSALSLSGEDKFGKDSNNYTKYGATEHLGGEVTANSASGRIGDLNLTGSAFIGGDTQGLKIGKVNVESAVNSYDLESKQTNKDIVSKSSAYIKSHQEENVAGNLQLSGARIEGNLTGIGSNIDLGENTFVGGKLTTDSRELHNSFYEKNTSRGFSAGISHGTASLNYGKSSSAYDEKDTINAKSNLRIGDGSVLNNGAEITATNFEYGNIQINNGDVKYGARIDTRDVHTESKSSSFGVSIGINSPALDRVRQVSGAVRDITNGNRVGGAINIANAYTGSVVGLANNQGNSLGQRLSQSQDSTAQVEMRELSEQEVKSSKANNGFYLGINASAGYNRSRNSSNSHTENAVVTTLKPIDGNSSITYNNVNNVTYQGTQAQNGTFIYNNVANIQKEAVELHNSNNSSGKSRGISVGGSLTLSPDLNKLKDGNLTGDKFSANSVSGNVSISGSRNSSNTDETIYQNGSFVNVNEIHNNTGTMTLIGFNQEGGKVTGNIAKLVVESKQNTSTTTGSSKGIGVGIPIGKGNPSVNVNGSRTNGNRAFVDNQSSFTVGEGSNLFVGTLENTGAIIGKENEPNTTFKIDKYIGHDLQNQDTTKTVGISAGTSGAGFNYSNNEKEGITRNTVVGNVEINEASGSEINRNISKANEVTKEKSTDIDVYAEDQLIKAVVNPSDFSEKQKLALREIKDITDVIANTVNNKGADNRGFIENLNARRRATAINNLVGEDLKALKESYENRQIDEEEFKDKLKTIVESVGRDTGIEFNLRYTDKYNIPKDSKNTEGVARIEDGKLVAYINMDEISSTSQLIGTVFEEVTHLMDSVAGRQKETKEEEKAQGEYGLESLGKPTNDYFREQYKEKEGDREFIGTGDGVDYSENDGEVVGNVVAAVAIPAFSIPGVGQALLVGTTIVVGGFAVYKAATSEEAKAFFYWLKKKVQNRVKNYVQLIEVVNKGIRYFTQSNNNSKNHQQNSSSNNNQKNKKNNDDSEIKLPNTDQSTIEEKFNATRQKGTNNYHSKFKGYEVAKKIFNRLKPTNIKFFKSSIAEGFSGKIKINGEEIKIAVRSSSSSLKTPTIDIWVSKSKHIEIRF